MGRASHVLAPDPSVGAVPSAHAEPPHATVGTVAGTPVGTPLRARTLRPSVSAADHAAACGIDVRLAMLARSPLFAGLDDAALARVNARCHAVAMAPGEVVYRKGEEAERLIVVATGQLKLLEHTADGGEVVLDLCVPGSFLGGAPMLGDVAYAHDAHALTHGCLLVLAADVFEAVVRDEPTVALNALRLTSQRLRDAQRTVQALSRRPVETQLAATLLRLAARLGGPETPAARLELALSQVDLAAMSGTTPESVSRTFAAWHRRGLVERGRGWIELRDRAALEALAEGG